MADGKTQTIRFKQRDHRRRLAGGEAAVPAEGRPAHRRLHRRARAAPASPKRMLIVGGGIIGLEMGTVYSTLGARLDVVEMLDGLMLGADRDLVKVWQKMNAPRFDNIMLKTKTVGAEATERRHPGAASKARARRRSRSSTTWCCRRSAACPTARRSAPTRPASTVSERGFIPVDIADAHQRAAHLRHRRHRRPADAGAQGGARGARGGRSGVSGDDQGAASTRA